MLNAIQPFPGFVYSHIQFHRHRDGQARCVEITVRPHDGIAAKCFRCRKPAPGYDQLEQRRFLFVPLWGIVTWFLYAARRVNCRTCGIVIEHVLTRIIDGSTPQPAQRFKPAAFLLWCAKQLTQAEKVFTCYEAGPFGYTLHRKLEKIRTSSCPACGSRFLKARKIRAERPAPKAQRGR